MMKTIREKIKNKNVLFIPVFSMRSYETGRYKLNCDGNMARVLSMIYKSEIMHADILIPAIERLDKDDYNELIEKVKSKGLDNVIEFKENSGYGENAKETRDSEKIYRSLIESKMSVFEHYDLIITEPQKCTEMLINDDKVNNDKMIYWCVASETISYSPWFTREYKEIDIKIAAKVTTACATQSQVLYLKGKSYRDEFYNADFSDMKIIFFPFRLSDPSYKADTLKEMIKKLNQEVSNFKVIITDPNESSEADELLKLDNVIKMKADFPVYLSILKGRPIIPYFENADEIKHISIEEMIKYNCEIICYENKELPDRSNITKVKDDKTFYIALKRTIQKN